MSNYLSMEKLMIEAKKATTVKHKSLSESMNKKLRFCMCSFYKSGDNNRSGILLKKLKQKNKISI